MARLLVGGVPFVGELEVITRVGGECSTPRGAVGARGPC